MAETKIGAIVAELKLNSSKFNRGVVKAEKTMKSFQSSIKKIGGSLIALAGVGGMGLFIKSTLDAADAIGKFADRAGVSTDELQKMRFAFDLAGVGVEAVDKALLVFGKRLGKARQGIGALEGGLKGGQEQLLITLKRTDSVSEALDVVFKAMGKAKDQTEKLAIADAAFGTAGLRMTAAFRDGSKAFFENKQAAQDLGIVIRADLIREAETLSDRMTTASKIMTTQLQAAFLEMVPAISSVVQATIDFIRELKVIEALTRKIDSDQSLGAAFGRVSEEIQNLEKILEANENSLFSSMFVELNNQIKEELESLRIIKKAIIDTVRAGGKISSPAPKKPKTPKKPREDFTGVGGTTAGKKQLDAQVKAFEAHNKKLLDIQREILERETTQAEKEFALFNEALAKFTTLKQVSMGDTLAQSPFSTLETNAIRATKAIELGLIDVEQQWGKTNEQAITMEETLKFFDDPLDDIARMAVSIEDVGKQLGLTQAEIEAALIRLDSAFDDSEEELSGWQKEVTSSLEQIRSQFESGLTNAFQDMLNGTESFKDAFIDILLTIQKEIIRTFIVGQLLKAIGGAVGGLFGGGAVGGGATDTLDPTLFDFRAEGGPVTAGRSFIVGEKGPEIFTPNSSGQIIPNDQLSMGGPSIVLQVTTGVQPTVRAELVQMLPKIQKTVEAGIANARQRGGQFSRAMGV